MVRSTPTSKRVGTQPSPSQESDSHTVLGATRQCPRPLVEAVGKAACSADAACLAPSARAGAKAGSTESSRSLSLAASVESHGGQGKSVRGGPTGGGDVASWGNRAAMAAPIMPILLAVPASARGRGRGSAGTGRIAHHTPPRPRLRTGRDALGADGRKEPQHELGGPHVVLGRGQTGGVANVANVATSPLLR
eukprot:scaffold13685_cov101-Isochrysis_galbana.AAC.2